MTLDDLRARRDALLRARFDGTASVNYDGREVTYKTDAQIAAAISAVETEIAKLERGQKPRSFHPQTSKGL